MIAAAIQGEALPSVAGHTLPRHQVDSFLLLLEIF